MYFINVIILRRDDISVRSSVYVSEKLTNYVTFRKGFIQNV